MQPRCGSKDNIKHVPGGGNVSTQGPVCWCLTKKKTLIVGMHRYYNCGTDTNKAICTITNKSLLSKCIKYKISAFKC